MGNGGGPGSGTDPVRGTSTSLEKSYFRLTSAPDPADVRPPSVLKVGSWAGLGWAGLGWAHAAVWSVVYNHAVGFLVLLGVFCCCCCCCC